MRVVQMLVGMSGVLVFALGVGLNGYLIIHMMYYWPGVFTPPTPPHSSCALGFTASGSCF